MLMTPDLGMGYQQYMHFRVVDFYAGMAIKGHIVVTMRGRVHCMATKKFG